MYRTMKIGEMSKLKDPVTQAHIFICFFNGNIDDNITCVNKMCAYLAGYYVDCNGTVFVL